MARVVHAALCALATLSLAGSATSESRGEFLRLLGAPEGWGALERPDPPDLPDYDAQADEDDAPVSEKRSAVATAMNGIARRRRQPARAFGKPVHYIGVGLLDDMGVFFHSLHDNVRSLAGRSPHERVDFFVDPPNVVHAQALHGGAGAGFNKLQAFRPLRPSGSTKTYSRRSYEEIDGVYPAANRHDPGLLWTGLGR